MNIGFRIGEFGFVSLTMYDIMGKEAAVLVNKNVHTASILMPAVLLPECISINLHQMSLPIQEN